MSIIIKEIEEKDYSQIVNLYNKYFTNQIEIQDRFNLHHLNPLVLPNKKKYSKGFVAFDERKIIGHIGAIPLEFNILGKRFTAYSTNSLVVDKNYRMIAPLLCKKFSNYKDVDFLINLTASQNASKLFQLFEFKKFDNLNNYSNNYFIINNKSFLNKFKKKFKFSFLFIYLCLFIYLKVFNVFLFLYTYLFSIKKIKFMNLPLDKKNLIELKKNLTSNKNFTNIVSGDWHFWRYCRHNNNRNFSHLQIYRKKENVIAEAILVSYPKENKIRISELYINDISVLSDIIIFLIMFSQKKGFDLLEFKINTNIANPLLNLFIFRKYLKFNPNLYKIVNIKKFDKDTKSQFDKFVSYFPLGDKIV